jgi:protein-S-isoprenylcysteine O-methyltransferase Ste14
VRSRPASPDTPPAGAPGARRIGALRATIWQGAMTVVYALALFACAGTAAWPAAWLYLLVMSGVLASYVATILKTPDLANERRKPPADAKRWDKPLVAIIGVVCPVALVLIAGFDRRFGWSGPMSAWWVAAGLVLLGAGGTLTNRAVAANRFFSAIIRIQRDRGHHVVDTGPYRYVRHPGYLGSILYMVGAALALSSWWALLLVSAVTVVVIVRTALEDRTLQAELDRYADYAGRVRFRLVPGVW